MKLSKLASGLLLTLLLVVFVVGCGSSDDGSTGGSGGTEVSTAGGGEYPSEDFWAGFEEVALDHDPGPVVDTSGFEKRSPDEELMIGYADASQSNAFRVMAKAETEQAIADVDGGGAKLVYTNANDSAPTQLSDVNDLITQGVDAIVLSAVDVSGVCSSISKAVSAGIPVIIQERTVKCPDYTSFISVDAVGVAENEMQYLAYRLDGEGEVAIISGIPGVGHSVASEEGYENVLAEYPDIELTNKEYASYDPTQAQQLASTILTANPDLDAFAVIDGDMTIGVVAAAEAAGKLDQLKAWTGNDVNGWMELAVEKDLPNLTVPYPVAVGSVAVEVAVKVLRGEEVHKTEFVPPWEPPKEFSEHLADYVNPERPAEWWYSEVSCQFDPFCE